MTDALARLDGEELAIQDAWAPAALKAQVELEKQRRVIMLDYFRSCMIEGHHYYRLPGQEERKPALSKEGAMNICSLYKVIPVPDEPAEIWHADGHYTVRYRTRIVSLATGQVVAVGDGICSTRESKYAYRQASKLCPSCGKPAIIKGKVDYGGGWLCWNKKDGCGAKFLDGDPTIEQQPSGRVPNEDLADQCNTVLKMSEKRSAVDGVLKLPLVSELFTQDMEEQMEREKDLHGGSPPSGRQEPSTPSHTGAGRGIAALPPPRPKPTAAVDEEAQAREEVMLAITTLLQHHVPHESPEAYVKFIPSPAMEVVRTIFGVQKWSELKGKSVDELRIGHDELLRALEPQDTGEEPPIATDDDVPDYAPPASPTTEPSVSGEGGSGFDGPALNQEASSVVAEVITSDVITSTEALPHDPSLASDAEVERVRIYADSHALGQILMNALAHYPEGIPQTRLEDIEQNLKYRVAQQAKAATV